MVRECRWHNSQIFGFVIPFAWVLRQRSDPALAKRLQFLQHACNHPPLYLPYTQRNCSIYFQLGAQTRPLLQLQPGVTQRLVDVRAFLRLKRRRKAAFRNDLDGHLFAQIDGPSYVRPQPVDLTRGIQISTPSSWATSGLQVDGTILQFVYIILHLPNK